MAIINATYKMIGVTPILMHNPISILQQENDVNIKKIPTPEEEAKLNSYALPDGTLYAPSFWFVRSLFKGSTSRRIGKNKAPAMVSSGVMITGEECILLDATTKAPIKEYVIDIRPVNIRGSRVPRARPKISNWMTLWNVDIDTDFITPEMVLELLQITGRVAGVGDFRPNKGGGSFGKYKAELVEKKVVVEDAEGESAEVEEEAATT